MDKEEKDELISKFREDLKNIKEKFRQELPDFFVEDVIEPYEDKWEKELSKGSEKTELR